MQVSYRLCLQCPALAVKSPMIKCLYFATYYRSNSQVHVSTHYLSCMAGHCIFLLPNTIHTVQLWRKKFIFAGFSRHTQFYTGGGGPQKSSSLTGSPCPKLWPPYNQVTSRTCLFSTQCLLVMGSQRPAVHQSNLTTSRFLKYRGGDLHVNVPPYQKPGGGRP